jgi:hypothetical protein
MTAYVASTLFSITLNLNSADSLTVTREGSIFPSGPSVASVVGAGSNVLVLNGTLIDSSTGSRGVNLNGGSNNVTVGASGFVFGNDAGIVIFGTGNNLLANSGEIDGQTNSGVRITGNSNTLNLFATSHVFGETDGVRLEGGSSSLTNIGTVHGQTGDGVFFGSGGNTIYNGGAVYGLNEGLQIGSGGANTIVNTGTIQSAFFDAIDSFSAINLTNSGTLVSGGFGINTSVDSAGSTIVNTGYIYGYNGDALFLGSGGDTVTNNGFMLGAFRMALGGGADFFDGRNGLQFGGVDGNSGDDILFGGAGVDDLHGGNDNDQLMGGANLDNLDGGAGFDYTRYDLGGAVTVSLAGPAANTGDAAGDSFTLIEGIIGSQFGDVIVGDGNVNTLMGLGGADGIAGGAGADTILGGDGADVLFGEADGDFITGGVGGDVIRGGLGADTFIYNVGDGGDLIQQFNEGGVQDHFDLRPYFDAISYAGTDPRGAGLMQVLQNGVDTDVYLQGNFMFRIEGVVAAAINDTYFLFQ